VGSEQSYDPQFDDLFAHQLFDPAFEPDEFGIPSARATSITCLIEPGRVCHDDNAVGEEDCFRNAVGDKDDRLALVLPDAQQFLLQNFARLRVNRAKRARPSVIYRGTVALGGKWSSDLEMICHQGVVIIFCARKGERG
jgi:hypothetical protein